MRKILGALILGIFLISFSQASILLETEPNSLYNLNDQIELNIKINPSPTISDLVVLKLSCEGESVEIYKEFLYVNEPTTKSLIVPLVKEFIGEANGMCEIESKIGENTRTISNKFKISNSLEINLETNGNQIEPGKITTLSGTVTRENGLPAIGTVELSIDDDEILLNSQIKDGLFTIDFPLSDKFKAGEHKIILKAYEKNKQGQITNHAEKTQSIFVMQIPTNLEILLDKKSVIPGESITGQILLRDQTGEEMSSRAYLAIKNQHDSIVEKIEINTNEQFTYPIMYNEAPYEWTLAVYADDIINKATVKILEKKEVSINLVNSTLIITNMGNVHYNATVPIAIGEDIINIDVSLPVGEEKKYSVSAPNGEYTVKAGDVEKTILLTGNAISLKEISESGWGAVKIIAWIFIIVILGLVAYMTFKKGYKKTFFGRITGRRSKKPMELKGLPQPEKLTTGKLKGELTLSITGSKQNTPVGCIYVKNYEEIKLGVGGVRETLNEISNIIEERKGVIYENKGNFFFIIPPTLTKTFKNEMPILEASKQIKELLDTHNKKFKVKINYGIALNFGTIVSKVEEGKFKFMSMGTLMTITKKLANRSSGEILINDKLRTRLEKEVIVQKVELEGLEAFEFKEIKEKVDNSKFINSFLAKQKAEGRF